MKTNKLAHLSAALGAIALLSQTQLTAQTLDPWQTVDDFQAIAGKRAIGAAIGTDATGTVIFSVGAAVTGADGTTSAIINRSSDGGANWETVDQLSLQVGADAAYGAFAADAGDGTLYVGGGLSDGAAGHWIVRQSNDGGSSWSTADDFQYAPGKASACTDLAADGQGTVYAVGRVTKANGATGVWAVRTRENGGPWSTVEALGGTTSSAGSYLGAMAVATHPNGSVFVAGATLQKGQAVWTVRRSTNRGASWTTVDATSPKEGSARAEAIAVDSTGIIYAVGYVNHFWVVRRSTGGGAAGTWELMETAMLYAAASGVTTVKRSDNLPDDVYVAGRALENPSNVGHWLVRKAAAGGRAFVFTDDYLLVPGLPAAANGIAHDAAGNLFTTGYARDAAVPHWITRKLAAP